MGGFLTAFSQKLAERWLTLLALPGALYLAVATAARLLGQFHALSLGYLARQLSVLAKAPGLAIIGGQIILLATVLAGAAAVGLAAQVLGQAAERLVLGADWLEWPWPLRGLAQWRVTARRARWDAREAAYQRLRHDDARHLADYGDRPDPAARHAAYRALNQIAETRPQRPTWSGERIHMVTLRLRGDLGIDVARIWPALWLTLPEATRTEITAARADLTRATTLIGWGFLYAPLSVWWWPAVLITAILAVTARQRTRTASESYAELVEAAVRLNLPELPPNLIPSLDAPQDGRPDGNREPRNEQNQ